MDMSKLDSNVKKQLHNAKYVTRLAKQRRAYTTTSLGTTAQVVLQSTTVRHLTYKEMKDLKTTKFMPSKVKQFKGEPPF